MVTLLHVMLTWSYQSRRVTAVRVAYNALEVVPVVLDARRYFPPLWIARARATHKMALCVEWVTKKGARNTFTNHG